MTRGGKNQGFLENIFRFLVVLRFFTYNCRTQNYEPQAKIQLCERQKSQFIFQYHLYKWKNERRRTT